jgi:hypothetical protein
MAGDFGINVALVIIALTLVLCVSVVVYVVRADK